MSGGVAGPHRRARLGPGDRRRPVRGSLSDRAGPESAGVDLRPRLRVPCEAACRRGKVPRVDADGQFVATDRPISIRALKRFACEQAGPEVRPSDEVLQAVRSYLPEVSADAEEMAGLLRAAVEGGFQLADGQPMAIIGAGPAGLAAAHDLPLMGLQPVIFETEPVPAGMLALGVPAYRLPRDLIAREVAVIQALGVEIRCGVTVGRDVSLAELRRQYAAVVIAVGAKILAQVSGFPGTGAAGVRRRGPAAGGRPKPAMNRRIMWPLKRILSVTFV